MFMGCETNMGVLENETVCETNTQSKSIIHNKIQTILHRQEKQHNKDVLKKPMI